MKMLSLNTLPPYRSLKANVSKHSIRLGTPEREKPPSDQSLASKIGSPTRPATSSAFLKKSSSTEALETLMATQGRSLANQQAAHLTRLAEFVEKAQYSLLRVVGSEPRTQEQFETHVSAALPKEVQDENHAPLAPQPDLTKVFSPSVINTLKVVRDLIGRDDRNRIKVDSVLTPSILLKSLEENLRKEQELVQIEEQRKAAQQSSGFIDGFIGWISNESHPVQDRQPLHEVVEKSTTQTVKSKSELIEEWIQNHPYKAAQEHLKDKIMTDMHTTA